MCSSVNSYYISTSLVPHPSSDEAEEVGKSFGGYTGLIGDIVTVNVSKVCKKLGIAIDGGANTKQKAVIIREISVSTTYITYLNFTSSARVLECLLLR